MGIDGESNMNLIKTSDELNNILYDLYEFDDDYEAFLEEVSDHYEPADNYDYDGDGEDTNLGIQIGVQLANKSIKSKKPIYKLTMNDWDFKVYFVKDFKEIESILTNRIKQAKEVQLDMERQDKELEIESIKKQIADNDANKINLQKRLRDLQKNLKKEI